MQAVQKASEELRQDLSPLEVNDGCLGFVGKSLAAKTTVLAMGVRSYLIVSFPNTRQEC